LGTGTESWGEPAAIGAGAEAAAREAAAVEWRRTAGTIRTARGAVAGGIATRLTVVARSIALARRADVRSTRTVVAARSRTRLRPARAKAESRRIHRTARSATRFSAIPCSATRWSAIGLRRSILLRFAAQRLDLPQQVVELAIEFVQTCLDALRAGLRTARARTTYARASYPGAAATGTT
jgi:hypothetical protein